MSNNPASGLTAASQPALLQQYLRAADTAIRAGDQARAAQLGDEAARRGIEHPVLLVLAGYAALNRGAPEEALIWLTRARELAPRNPDGLNALGLSLIKLNRQRESLAVFDAALRQAPGMAAIHFNKASALEDLSELTRASAGFERALQLQPIYPEALARLANIAALRADAKAAREFADRALRQDPRQIAAMLALATVDIEEKKYDDALTRLAPLTGSGNQSVLNRLIAQGLMGDALDAQGRTSEAFAAYTSSNILIRELYKPHLAQAGAEPARSRVERLIGYFDAAEPEKWRARKDRKTESPVVTHVFMVGFPRSGTTLLEQVLASHPDIEAMEERDCLIDADDAFVLPQDGPERLAAASDEELAQFRKAYWKRAAEAGYSPRRPVFVDKMPLNTILLCLVAKIFPDAKVLFALRDPRDCVLSCFRRRFGMTLQMYELTDLESAAGYYDAVMRLAAVYRDKLALDTLDLRYEDMVADFDTQTQRVCEFLGIGWREEMRAFAGKSRERDVNTPSAVQVARGLFTGGAGQWQRYRRELAPVLPRLAPWVARFGYAENGEP